VFDQATIQHEMKTRLAPYLLVVPAAAIFASLFVASTAYFFVMSFWKVRLFRPVPDFSFANYHKTVETFYQSALTTLAIAFVIALAATSLGFLYAWLIRFKAGRLGPALLFISLVTLFGGYLMKIYAWKTLLGGDGVINTALASIGLIKQPIEMLLYSPFAVVLTLTHFLLPFAILPIYGSLRGITDAEIESARDLGARPLRIFLDVIVPRSRVGLVAGFALCFLVCVGDYVTPRLVGGTMAMFGQMIQLQFGTVANWPLGSAMSFSILAVALAILVLLGRALGLVGRQ
jgi:spermidine/putrescine transport system permease protein